MAVTPPPPPTPKRADEVVDGAGAGAGAGAAGQGGAVLRRTAMALLLVAAVALPCLVLYRAAVAPAGVLALLGAGVPWRQADTAAQPPHAPDLDSDQDVRLERVLRAAAMANDTVILTTLNSAWSEPGSMVDVFLESFRIGEDTRELLDHLVIVSLDLTAHQRCKQIHPHCFTLVTDGVDFSGQKNFMTDGYLKMMWRRIDFLRAILEKGFSFVFTDTDIVWFRNPMPHFYPDSDFQIACDRFNGNPNDMRNDPNGGFTYVRANEETIKFYKFWYTSREKYPGLHDQDVLNLIKNDPFVSELGVKIKFLSTDLFGGLCEPSRNFSKVCTMHANCCIGMSRKVSDLNVMLEDWRRFMALPQEDKHSASWSVPRNCSLKALED